MKTMAQRRTAKTENDNRRAKSMRQFEIKTFDDAARTFTGIASTWNEDLGGDVIHQGAFKRTLDAWRASKSKIIPLIDLHGHDSVRRVVGKLISAGETGEGLECVFEVIDGPDGDEIWRRVKGGFVNGLSIGYRAIKWEIEEGESGEWWDRIRHLKEIELEEISVVIWGMNPEALIDSMKALLRAAREDDPRVSPEEKAYIRAELEKLLQEQDDALQSDDDDEAPEVKSTSETDAPAAEEEAFEMKLLQLKLGRLGTRAAA
jgi:HK97 family phage prohead protease